jgi:hypothetical protein
MRFFRFLSRSSNQDSRAADGHKSKAIAWLRRHIGEIGWAALFGLAVAIGIALYQHFVPGPRFYSVQLIQLECSDGRCDSKSNQKLFEEIAKAFGRRHRIQGVPVVLQWNEIPNDAGESDVDLTKKEAKSLKDDRTRNPILAISQLDSEPLEKALPVLLEETQPPIPVLATSETDDNLLRECRTWSCSGDSGFAPLLQLPPTNREQADAAVRYAKQNSLKTFSIVIEDPPFSSVYAKSMSASLQASIEQRGDSVPEPQLLSKFRASSDKNVDCIFYVGGLTHARELLTDLQRKGSRAMVILSDTAVQAKITATDLQPCDAARDCGVRFLDIRDADDWNNHTDSYLLDAQAIAGQLIDSLDRWAGWGFRLKCVLNLETADDVRQRLVEEMKSDLDRHISYDGWVDPSSELDSEAQLAQQIYAFRTVREEEGFNRFPYRLQARFHVWEPRATADGEITMEDVDHWHPARRPHGSDTAMRGCQCHSLGHLAVRKQACAGCGETEVARGAAM